MSLPQAQRGLEGKIAVISGLAYAKLKKQAILRLDIGPGKAGRGKLLPVLILVS